MFEWYSTIIELLICVAGGFGLLQKVADMERYHQLRVVVLTALFSLAVILFFVTNVRQPVIRFEDTEDTFTLSDSF